VFKLFLARLGALGEGVGFGLEGLGEPLGAQHAWLLFAGEAKGGVRRATSCHRLLSVLGRSGTACVEDSCM